MAKKKVKKAAKKTAKKAAKKVAKKTAAKTPAKEKKMTMGLAVVSLLLNVFIIPGLGTLVAGRTRTGAWQIVLSVAGYILWVVAFLGVPIVLAAWIWGLVSGIKFIQQARA